MSIFYESMTMLDKKLAIPYAQLEVDLSVINSNYKFESAMEEIDPCVMTEAEAEARTGNAFTNFIAAIVAKVKKFFQSIREVLDDVFAKGDNIDFDAYKNSEGGNMELQFDIMKVQDAVDDKLREGRNIIMAISRATHIDSRTVEDFCDSSARLISDHSGTIISTATGALMYKALRKKAGKANQQFEEAAALAKKFCGKDPKKQEACRKVLNTMANTIADSSHYMNIFAKEYNRSVKKNNKRDKMEAKAARKAAM